MESDKISPGSKDWEYVSPSSLEIKEIKQKLLSGEKHQILESVEKIKMFIKNDNCLTELIRSDITEFLCDAMLPFDDITVEILFNCLESLTNHIEFYCHGHACFSIESLIRSIYFFLKNSSNSTGLSQSLNLLILILQGYNTFEVHPERKTIENLLQIMPLLLQSTTTTIYCKYQTGNLILALLNLNIVQWGEEIFEIILSSILSWCNLINDVLDCESPLRERTITLYCAVGHSLMRSLEPQDDLSESINIEINHELMQNVILNISNFLINVAATYFNNLSMSLIETDPSDVEIFFECLLYLYSDRIPSRKSWITHGLCEMEFFQFITKILSFFDINCQKLQKLCMLVLSYMIMFLSQDVFQFPEFWPNGQHAFYREIQEGMSRLPPDVSQWLHILTNPHSPGSCKSAVLLYLYFYSMTVKSQDALERMYPFIINFINFSNALKTSALLQKTVWFVYVMAQLSNNQNSYVDGELEAANKLVSVLEEQEDLSLPYTHHPALLYWAFSSRVNKSIQFKIVRLWFLNKTSDCKVLEDLIETSSDLRFAIMDVMQNECGQVLESAFLSLKSNLLKTRDNDLASNIWLLLWQVLARYTTDSSTATNADYLIELASLKTPSGLDITKIIRIASLLPEIFLKSNLIAVVPSLALIFQLLEMGLQMKDFRVMHVFLRVDGFILKILKGINANITETCCYSLKIITLLWRNGNNIDTSQNFKKAKVDKEIVAKALEHKNCEVLSSTLGLLQEILLTSFSSRIFEIEEVDSSLVEILFSQIQNICIKNIPEITEKCWRCLKLFLLVKSPNENLIDVDLIADPLLHEVINHFIPNLKNSDEMKDFVAVWLRQNSDVLSDSCFKRKIFGRFFFETAQNIGQNLGSGESELDLTIRRELVKIGVSLN